MEEVERLLKNDTECHRLKRPWTFWYLVPNRHENTAVSWLDFLKKLHDFQCVEDFFAILNSVDRINTVPRGCRYYVFEKGIKPVWEDEKNNKGYVIGLDVNCRAAGESLDAVSAFEQLTLSIIGNTDPIYECVNGVEYNSRGRNGKLAIWTREISEETVDALKAKLAELCKPQGELFFHQINLDPKEPYAEIPNTEEKPSK